MGGSRNLLFMYCSGNTEAGTLHLETMAAAVLDYSQLQQGRSQAM